jgi:hypothetical protein
MQHVADSALPVKMLRVLNLWVTLAHRFPQADHDHDFIVVADPCDRSDRPILCTIAIPQILEPQLVLACVRAQAEQVKHSRPLASTLASSWTSAKLSAIGAAAAHRTGLQSAQQPPARSALGGPRDSISGALGLRTGRGRPY